MRLPRSFWLMAAVTVAQALSACGINDRNDASPDQVTVRTYADVSGDVPPFTGTLGQTFFTSRSAWNCLIHPDAASPRYNPDDLRCTRVVVHELGHTLRSSDDTMSHDFPYGCYMLDSDATLDGLPPLCPEEAAMAREWALGHGARHVKVGDEWLRGHVERAVKVWNDGAGVVVFDIEE